MHKILALLMLVFSTVTMNAQQVEMATGMRSEGKIYVVVVVVLIIFIGLALYLFSLDKKVSKLEKNNSK